MHKARPASQLRFVKVVTGAGSATILGCAGPRLTLDEARFFADIQPVGFILFARNIEAPDQVRALCADLRKAVGRNAPIFVDQEGGRVQRLRAPHWREWMPPLDQISATGDRAARAMYLRSYLIGREHSALGIDGNCAPCADIARDITHPFLRNRCYGQTLEDVVKNTRAVANGLMDAGVHPVLKHIPGHGLGTADSHLDLPRVMAAAENLHSTDFAAFASLKDIPWGMSAHVVYEAFDADLPATLSFKMMRIIRQDIGFDGLLMTDDLSMNALPGAIHSRASAAKAAGCDVILHCNGDLTEMKAVAKSAGVLTPTSQKRLARALQTQRKPIDLDIATAEAELDALLAGTGDV